MASAIRWEASQGLLYLPIALFDSGFIPSHLAGKVIAEHHPDEGLLR